MPIVTGVAVGAGAVTIGGVVAQNTTGNTGTSVAIIGAIAVVLVAAIGVIGNYISNRRSGPAPPGGDIDLIGMHDRMTVMETNLAEWRHRQKNTETLVAPLAEVTRAHFEDVQRRLDRIEERLWPPD